MPDIKELDVRSKPGYIIIRRASGPPVEYPLTDLITTGDVPTGLTHTHVAALGALANLFAILIRTLIERDILDETFADHHGMYWDLDHIIFAIDEMGGQFDNPDLDKADEEG